MFLLGHWENYEVLEEKLSLPELMATLEAVEDRDYKQNRFMAALKGVDLDKETGNREEEAAPDIVQSGIVDLKSQSGFGVGMGLGYEEE